MLIISYLLWSSSQIIPFSRSLYNRNTLLCIQTTPSNHIFSIFLNSPTPPNMTSPIKSYFVKDILTHSNHQTGTKSNLNFNPYNPSKFNWNNPISWLQSPMSMMVRPAPMIVEVILGSLPIAVIFTFHKSLWWSSQYLETTKYSKIENVNTLLFAVYKFC